jgi:hypothetical protein
MATRKACKNLRAQGATASDFKASFSGFLASGDPFLARNRNMAYAVTKGWHAQECVRARKGETLIDDTVMADLRERYKDA